MSALATQGTCSYNGYLFPVEHETLSLVATPVQDAAKRTIVYVVYAITIHFKAYIAAGSDMNSTMDTIRKQLTAQGGAFRYEDKGLGNISVNVAGQRKKDVLWGPVPGPLKLRQIGINAVDGVWQVTVAIPECDNASFDKRIMEFNFKVAFAIETNGYQKRTYSGHIRIPMTRNSQSNRSIPDSIDNYRDKIYPALIPGFRRIPGTFTIDESKTRLDFQIEDVEEGPNYVPPGCVTASASHEYGSTTQAGGLPNFVLWHGTIRAEYEIVRGTDPYVAWDAFWELVKARIDFMKAFQSADAVEGPAPAVWKSLVPMKFHVSEPEIYGPKKASYSFNYAVSFSAGVLLHAGLWQPVPGSNWQQWAKPLSAFAWTPFGNAGLYFNATTEDAIIDLCLPPARLETSRLRNVRKETTVLRRKIPPIPPPAPDGSWLHYKNSLRIEIIPSTVIHQPLGTSSTSSLSTGGRPTSGQLQATFPQVGYKPPPQTKGPDTIIQQRGGPQVFIIMEGSAARVLYEIPEPKLVSIGGMPMFRYDQPGDGFKQHIAGTSFWPIYVARWRIRYALPNTPRNVPVPPIPGTSSMSSLNSR